MMPALWAKIRPRQGSLRGFGTDKGEGGVKNPQNLADVICTPSPFLIITGLDFGGQENGVSDTQRIIAAHHVVPSCAHVLSLRES